MFKLRNKANRIYAQVDLTLILNRIIEAKIELRFVIPQISIKKNLQFEKQSKSSKITNIQKPPLT